MLEPLVSSPSPSVVSLTPAVLPGSMEDNLQEQLGAPLRLTLMAITMTAKESTDSVLLTPLVLLLLLQSSDLDLDPEQEVSTLEDQALPSKI